MHYDARDLAAAVLAGIATTTRRVAPRDLGRRVGLVLWSESGLTEANVSPWAHVDIAAVRTKVEELAAAHHLRLPNRWTADAVARW